MEVVERSSDANSVGRRTISVFAKTVILAATLSVGLALLAACGSVSPTFTPEQLQYGVGCHQGDAATYCGRGG
jgi:hypothetical protein